MCKCLNAEIKIFVFVYINAYFFIYVVQHGARSGLGDSYLYAGGPRFDPHSGYCLFVCLFVFVFVFIIFLTYIRPNHTDYFLGPTLQFGKKKNLDTI